LTSASPHILCPVHSIGNAAFTLKGMTMSTLTLKSRNINPVLTTSPATTVVAGKSTMRSKNCAPVLDQLSELVRTRSKVFIQMRHGAGYCGIPVQIEGYWLTMIDVSIHGTKQQAAAQRILIQINDGSFIGHLHAVDESLAIGGTDE
jgi:uncharacterized lipoprotein YddW (UPF0748 family)